MKKIRDRFILGGIAGLGGNLVKLAIGQWAYTHKKIEITSPHRAAGMLVAGHRITDTKGQVAGVLADCAIGGFLGVVFTYLMSISGKDRAILKGAMAGEVAWTMLYGALATMGATTVKGVSPQTVLVEFAEHTVYGAVTAWLVASMGDPGLFNGEIPLTASGLKPLGLKDRWLTAHATI